MKKTRLILSLIALICFSTTYAQIENFKLSDYKLPNLERRTLETNFNFSGNNNYQKIEENFNDYEQKENRNNYNGGFNINYNYYLNNLKIQRFSNLKLSLSSNINNHRTDGISKTKNNSINPSINYQLINRMFFEKEKFIETDLNFDWLYYNSNYYLKDLENNIVSIDENNKNMDMTISIPIKAGIGRIEEVQDARQAVYIFQELSKIDRSSQEKTNGEIIKFAELISQIKNRRFFDSRLREIAEIETLDSFLVVNNYIKKSDAKYFTTLKDFWDYGNRAYRKSGSRYAGVVVPEYSYQHKKNTNDLTSEENKSTLNVYGINLGVEINREKPIDLYWQNSISFHGYYGISNRKYKDIDNKERTPKMDLGVSQTIGYYPNTRTDFVFGYSLKYLQIFNKDDKEDITYADNLKNIDADIYLSINYYISPQFRLSFNTSLDYLWSKEDYDIYYQGTIFTSTYNRKTNNFNNQFSLSLIYSLF